LGSRARSFYIHVVVRRNTESLSDEMLDAFLDHSEKALLGDAPHDGENGTLIIWGPSCERRLMPSLFALPHRTEHAE
jgi:hypothetical protein